MRRTILITGATGGLGRELARRAHAEGWEVLAHGRDAGRLERLAGELDGIRTLRADLASLEETAALADAVTAAADRLDVLVNNAGVGFTEPGGGERVESADGHELRLAVNYLAPYALTTRLLDLLRASAPARIVNVASRGQAPLDFADPMLARDYSGRRAYSRSKLALIMFTFDLATAHDPATVTANAIHPATFMPTAMVRDAGIEPVTPLEQGVDATWRLIADRGLAGVSGRYFNGRGEERPDAQAFDLDARRALRELSERLVRP
jgi:NAD(P)-dependent dehydrogenase (short-subunit alcohol dehydrogenase family)